MNPAHSSACFRNHLASSALQPPPGQGGFSLIELMISLVIGLIVIGSATAVYLSNKESFRSNQSLGQVQENSRIAFELMARDIRQAGLTGCGNLGRVANVLNNGSVNSTTPAWYANFANAIRGYDGGATDPAVTTGTAAAQRVTGTDSITLIGAAESGVSIASHNLSTFAFALNESSSTLQAGDIVVICDPDHAAIMQITSISSGAHTVTTGTTTPGNCSRGLGFPTSCATVAGNSYQFAVNSQLTQLLAVDWYIGVNPQGSRSLYRMTTVNSSGTPTATAQEMVRNVTDMQITYHSPGNASFVSADSITAANWTAVDAIRLTLTFQSFDRYAGTGAAPITRQMSTTVTLRNRVS